LATVHKIRNVLKHYQTRVWYAQFIQHSSNAVIHLFTYVVNN